MLSVVLHTILCTISVLLAVYFGLIFRLNQDPTDEERLEREQHAKLIGQLKLVCVRRQLIQVSHSSNRNRQMNRLFLSTIWCSRTHTCTTWIYAYYVYYCELNFSNRAAEARNRIRIMRLRYQANRAQEISHLISCQPSALNAVRLQALLPTKTEQEMKDDTLERLAVRNVLCYFSLCLFTFSCDLFFY